MSSSTTPSTSPSSESTDESVRRGSCLCKSVQYTLRGEPITFRVCHCPHCKKATGSAFLTNGFFEENQIYIIKGEDILTKYSDTGTRSGHHLERYFCRICGSNVFMRSLVPLAIQKKLKIVCLGTLDDEVEWVPRTEVFPELRRAYVQGIELEKKKPKL